MSSPSVSYGGGATAAEYAFHHGDGHLAGSSLSTKPRYEVSDRDWSTYRKESLHRRYAEMTTSPGGSTTAALRPSLLDESPENEKREGSSLRRERAAEGIIGSSIWSIAPADGEGKGSIGAI